MFTCENCKKQFKHFGFYKRHINTVKCKAPPKKPKINRENKITTPVVENNVTKIEKNDIVDNEVVQVKKTPKKRQRKMGEKERLRRQEVALGKGKINTGPPTSYDKFCNVCQAPYLSRDEDSDFNHVRSLHHMGKLYEFIYERKDTNKYDMISTIRAVTKKAYEDYGYYLSADELKEYVHKNHKKILYEKAKKQLIHDLAQAKKRTIQQFKDKLNYEYPDTPFFRTTMPDENEMVSVDIDVDSNVDPEICGVDINEVEKTSKEIGIEIARMLRVIRLCNLRTEIEETMKIYVENIYKAEDAMNKLKELTPIDNILVNNEEEQNKMIEGRRLIYIDSLRKTMMAKLYEVVMLSEKNDTNGTYNYSVYMRLFPNQDDLDDFMMPEDVKPFYYSDVNGVEKRKYEEEALTEDDIIRIKKLLRELEEETYGKEDNVKKIE